MRTQSKNRRPKRLLSIAHSYVIANNRRLAHQMAIQGRGEWEVTAVAPDYFHGGNDLRPAHLEPQPDEPCPVVSVRANLTKRVHIFTYGRALRRLLRRGWDVVHCWEEPYILVGGQIARWTPRDTKLVYRTAQSLNKRYPPPFNWVERYSMRRAAGWICSGSLVEQNLTPRRGYTGLPRRRIPLGVDLDQFRPDAAAGSAIKQQLGWAESGPPVVGYLGRLVPEKGLTVLTEALDRAKQPWRALFVGAGPMQGQLETWAARHGDRIRICTDVKHAYVPPYLNAMDILAAPSQTAPNWKEQFGRMLTEAFASGVAVIGSDSGEIPYVIEEAGLVVPEKDVDGWAAALDRLLADGDLRRDFAARGRDRAERLYSLNAVARQHLDFFDELIADSAAASAGTNRG